MSDRSEIFKFYVQIIDHCRRVADALDGLEPRRHVRALMTTTWKQALMRQHKKAYSEAEQLGMETVLFPVLREIREAHFEFSDAALKESEGNGGWGDTNEAMKRHAAALSALADFLHVVDDAKRKKATEANGKKGGGEKPVDRKTKKSTQKGDAETEIIPVLTKHHKYADGGCLNGNPINLRELARDAHVSPSSASRFFNKHFLPKGEKGSGHAAYAAACRRNFNGRVLPVLKSLNGDYTVEDTYGNAPPGEQGRHDV